MNQLVARILAELRAMVAPGVTTQEIDAVAEARVRAGGRRAGVQGVSRVSGDGVRVGQRAGGARHPVDAAAGRGRHPLDRHGREARRVLRRLRGDGAGGPVSAEATALLRVTEEALFHGIEAVKPGARVSDIGAAVQQHVEAHGFSVVREFVGHGIGTSLHEEPQIANYGPGGRGPRLSEGMVLAIEPMVNVGKPAVKVLADGWTAVTRDGSLSAHFEHTVVVTRDGCEILTLLESDGSARGSCRARRRT